MAAKQLLSFFALAALCVLCNAHSTPALKYFTARQAASPHQQDITLCDNQAQCADRCSCQVADGQGICMDVSKVEDFLTCFCETNGDCSAGDDCVAFDSSSKVCVNCANAVSSAAVEKCSPSSDSSATSTPPPSVIAEPATTPAPAPTPETTSKATAAPKETVAAAPASPEAAPAETPSSAPAATAPPTVAPVATAPAETFEPEPVAEASSEVLEEDGTVSETEEPCVETKWLEEQGLMDQALRHGNAATVLCIPGLPCGTKGHMLRRCDAEGCSLQTYKEVCETRLDCTESSTPVSQLSHTFDWSIFQLEDLELTSLSAHPLSGTYSISRLTARIGDLLNKRKLGFVCNSVVRMNRLLSTKGMLFLIQS